MWIRYARTLLTCALAAGMFSACGGGTGQPAPTPTIPPTIPAAYDVNAFGYGIQVHGSIGEVAGTMSAVRQLGLGWIKQQVRWGDMSPAPGQVHWEVLDRIVEGAAQQRLKVLLSVVNAPVWSRAAGNSDGPPDDPQVLAEFLRQVVTRYRGRVHAIEVWNEQNLDREWQTAQGLAPNQYVFMLGTAAVAIKKADPGVLVISGGLAPTGGASAADGRTTAVDDFVYLEGMLKANLLAFVDCVGVHHNGYNIGPAVAFDAVPNDPTAVFRGPFDNPHHSWSFLSTLQGYHDRIKAAGGDKKLCVTEFGWATTEGLAGPPRAGFEFALDNTLREQADWDVAAFQFMRQSGYVRLATLWNLDFGPKGGGDPSNDTVPYSILTAAGAPRPAFDALAAMPKN